MYLRQFFIVLCFAQFVIGQDSFKVSFDELPELVQQTQYNKLLNIDYQNVLHEKKNALQFTNPFLEFERENIRLDDELEQETVIELSKNITFPWKWLGQRNYWQSRTKQAELYRDLQQQYHLVNVQKLYIKARLAQELYIIHDECLGQIKTIFDIFKARAKQGTVSNLEYTLFTFASGNFERDIITFKNKKKMAYDEFVAASSLHDKNSVLLSTKISFTTLDFPKTESLIKSMENSVHYKLAQQNILESKTALTNVRNDVLPEIELSGGYKNINDTFNGYVIGASLPLPVFNLNRAEVNIHKNELVRQELVYDAYVKNVQLEIKRSLAILKSLQDYLINYKIENPHKLFKDIQVAYAEGWLSVPELTNSLEMLMNGLTNYYQSLGDYYSILLDFGVLTNTEFDLFTEE